MEKKKNSVGKVVGNIFIIIIVIILLIVGYCSFQTLVLKKDYVNIGGYTFLEVASGSMGEAISVNDLVIVKLENKDIKKNDIVTYKSGNNLITHRVVKINEQEIITKGDSNNTYDSPIKQGEIIGKVVKIVPGVGIWREVLQTPKVIISFMITLILFGGYFSYRDYLKVKGR